MSLVVRRWSIGDPDAPPLRDGGTEEIGRSTFSKSPKPRAPGNHGLESVSTGRAAVVPELQHRERGHQESEATLRAKVPNRGTFQPGCAPIRQVCRWHVDTVRGFDQNFEHGAGQQSDLALGVGSRNQRELVGVRAKAQQSQDFLGARCPASSTG